VSEIRLVKGGAADQPRSARPPLPQRLAHMAVFHANDILARRAAQEAEARIAPIAIRDNVAKLVLEAERAERRTRWILALSVLTFLMAVATLLITLV